MPLRRTLSSVPSPALWRVAACAALMALSLGSVACQTGGQRPEQRFEPDLRAFHDHMRWARYDDASAFIPEADRWDFLGEYEEKGKDFEITEYEIRRVDPNPSGNREGPVHVTVWVQFFRLPETRVHERTYRERWRWNDDRKMWEVEERRARED